MNNDTHLLIEVLGLAQERLDSMTDEEIQEHYGSDFYHELQRFCAWEGLKKWRERHD